MTSKTNLVQRTAHHAQRVVGGAFGSNGRMRSTWVFDGPCQLIGFEQGDPAP